MGAGAAVVIGTSGVVALDVLLGTQLATTYWHYFCNSILFSSFFPLVVYVSLRNTA